MMKSLFRINETFFFRGFSPIKTDACIIKGRLRRLEEMMKKNLQFTTGENTDVLHTNDACCRNHPTTCGQVFIDPVKE